MKKKLSLFIFMICIAVLAVSLWKLFGIYAVYQDGDSMYEEIAEQVVTSKGTMSPSKSSDESEDGLEQKETEELITVDFGKLKKTNEDIVGWLYIPNSSISYPLLYGQDNEQYLHQTYNKTKSIFGSIFVDYRNTSDFSDLHTIIYGHNMKNGSMFGTLKKYGNKEFWNKHRNIYIFTEKGTYRYRVFSCHEADALGKVYTPAFAKEEEYQEYLDYILESSYFKTKMAAGVENKTITLSTCTGKDEKRFVVHGKYMGEVKE